MKVTDDPVVVSQVYSAPIDEVWKAITEKDRMLDWFFFEMKEFDPVVGFETQFSVEHDEQTYVHCWKLTEVVPNKKIVYDWSYDGVPGRGLVVWELDEVADGTNLTLTNSIVEDFPQDNPAFQRESAEEGWKFLIQQALRSHLEDEGGEIEVIQAT